MIKLIKFKQEEIPTWIEDVKFFDDDTLISAKNKNIEKIIARDLDFIPASI